MSEPNKDQPQDPLTLLAAAAAGAHEMFRGYVEAGFTEQQALYLVGQVITAATRGNTA